MAIVQSAASEKKRVKVYELRINDWFDRGTGFCCPQTIHDEAKVQVESEDEPVRELLDLHIKKEDTYQKQQETLIVWTDPDGVDMALSFQEAEGCGVIWDLIKNVQQRLLDGHGELYLHQDEYISSRSSLLSDNAPSPLQLPPAQLQNLELIEDVIRRGTTTQQARDAVLKLIFPASEPSYISQLTAMVEVAEDLESLPDLHRLCNIMKTLILYNDSTIIEFVVRDEQILGFVGALECELYANPFSLWPPPSPTKDQFPDFYRRPRFPPPQGQPPPVPFRRLQIQRSRAHARSCNHTENPPHLSPTVPQRCRPSPCP